MRRAVITGMGVVSPLGCDLERFWERIRAGQSGVRPIEKFDASQYEVRIAGQVTEFDVNRFIDRKEQRRMDEFCWFAMGAASLAITDSGLNMSAETPERVGVIVGSGVGGLQTLEEQHTILREKGPSRCSPFMIPQMIVNMAGGLIAIKHNMKGPNFCVVSACASAAHSLGDGLRLIQRGDADVIMTGGSEAPVCPLGVAGFTAMRALSRRNDEPQRASRPFDRDRDGFVIAEGAAIMVLEELEHARKRGAKIYCEVAGMGATCDAYHMTAPSDDGEGAARAMKIAMQDAGLRPEDVHYINAHGTSTSLNDKFETMAIKTALGPDASRKVMISSSKSMTGHMLGAAAGIETVVCALALRDGIVPPTINYENADPECDLDYVPNTSRNVKIKAALNNSLGFGGHNACIAIKAMA